MHEYKCENCGTVGEPTRHGKCSSCGSDSIADVIDPQPVRYQEPRPTGIERAEVE